MVNQQSNQLTLIIEDKYPTGNSKYVGPLRFSQGLGKWSFSGNKTVHAIDSSSSACGSITTLRTFLNENAKDTINECFPENDVDNFSDNIQKKGKTTSVKEDRATTLNVATNVVFLQSNPPTNYQSDFSLSPRHWLNENNNFANDILVFENEIFKSIFPLIVTWYKKNISKSKNDPTSITENTDTVQKLIEWQEQDNSKTLCVACLNILSTSSNKCESCSHCPKTQISRDLLYGDVPAEHTKEKPSIKIDR